MELPAEKNYEEKDLLRELSEGNEKAFRQLYDTWQPLLLTYVYRLTKSLPITEELVQDIFVKLWAQREKLAEVEQLKSYLFTVAKNCTLDQVRKAIREKEKQQQYEAHYRSAHTTWQEEQPAGANPEELLLEKAVSALPEQQQKVYRLSKQRGLTYEQIGRQLDISPLTVKHYMKLAIASIKKYISAAMPHDTLPWLLLAVLCGWI